MGVHAEALLAGGSDSKRRQSWTANTCDCPSHLKADAVYGDVLNEVVRRLKEITDKFEPTVQPQTPKGDPP